MGFAGNVLAGKPVRYQRFVQFEFWNNKLKMEYCEILILGLEYATHSSDWKRLELSEYECKWQNYNCDGTSPDETLKVVGWAMLCITK